MVASDTPRRRAALRRLAAWSLAPAGGGLARAQDPAARPVTLVVPYPPGGATDTVARLLARALAPRLGRAVVVDNRAGAGSVVGAGHVARAAPDGHTLLISSNTTFTVNPALKRRLPYDPLTSFEPLGLLGSSPLVLLAHPTLPVRTLRALVALARARPGQLSYASFGVGTTAHLAGEMLRHQAGVDLVHVPYKGSAPAMQDLLAGQVPLGIDTAVAALPPLRAGRLRALAVTSAQPSALLPDVPTVASAGYPGYELLPWLAVVAPRGLPAGQQAVLARALADSLADPGTRAALVESGLDVAPEPPQAYERRVAEELPRLRAYVHRAGISVE